MRRNVYFAFHYQDVADFRANVVRNLPKIGNIEFNDRSLWEREWTRRPEKIRMMISQGLLRTHVTCVLIGRETWQRPWVRYEIVRSLARGNGIFAVHINRVRDKNGRITTRGRNPLDYIRVTVSDNAKYMIVDELQDGRWLRYEDSPAIRTQHFWSWHAGTRFLLSEQFPTYCFKNDDGKSEFDAWIDAAESQAIPTIRT